MHEVNCIVSPFGFTYINDHRHYFILNWDPFVHPFEMHRQARRALKRWAGNKEVPFSDRDYKRLSLFLSIHFMSI